MKNRLRIPGFPPPEKQDIVKFHMFKSLPYSTRMKLYLGFVVAGFLFQIIMLKAWPGAILLLLATLLSLVRDYDTNTMLGTFRTDSNWTTVNIDKILQIEDLNKKMSEWDSDALDISNGKGALVFILMFISLLFATSILGFYGVMGNIFFIDAIILLIPLWFNGIRKILKKDNLRIKVDIVRKLESFFQTIKKDGEHFKPALMLSRDKKTGKCIPLDCRFTITFENMPSGFYGIQAQINLNNVQGTSYPYFYCVIAAEPGFGLANYVKKVPVPKNILVKYEGDENADVLVIRQRTTKTSGYHTNMNACKSIFERSLVAARLILNR